MTSLGRLRDVRDEDLEPMRQWRNAPAVRENMYTSHVISIEEHAEWWAAAKDDLTRRTLIYEKGDVAYGVLSLTSIDSINGRASWGIFAAPHAASGTGSNMLYLAFNLGFGDLKLNRMWGEALAFNKRAISLYMKFGLDQEGILRQHVRRGEEFVDVLLFSMLAEEWVSRRSAMHDLLCQGEN